MAIKLRALFPSKEGNLYSGGVGLLENGHPVRFRLTGDGSSNNPSVLIVYDLEVKDERPKRVPSTKPDDDDDD